jgi:hypothetical protein
LARSAADRRQRNKPLHQQRGHYTVWPFAAIAAALQGAFWPRLRKLTYIAGEVKEPQRNVPHQV